MALQELETETIPEYSGPTADDLRREAEAFKANWEKERQAMLDAAQQEAAKIVEDAEQRAFQEIQDKTKNANALKAEAEAEANRIKSEAQMEADKLRSDAQAYSQQLEADTSKKGYDEGYEKGYQLGRVEADRLVDRLNTIITKTIERRTAIIEESEAQLVQLVLQISKKVVKVLSENQKNVVINNVVQALRKIRSKTDIIVHLNMADMDIASERKKDFVRMMERIGNLSLMEDGNVDPGGCIVETDFGEIDARIASQLREIEDKILEAVPIRSKSMGAEF